MTQNQVDNLLSGLLGGLIAVALTFLLERLRYATKLNRIRIAILDYLKETGHEKIVTYIDDMVFVLKLLNGEEKDESLRNPDDMPMFTSELFKSYLLEELRQVCFRTKTYIKFLDMYYSIDFLKKNMPLQIYNGYTEKLYVHYKEKNLVTIDEQIEHLKTCGAVNAYRRGAENEANLKCKRAQFTHRQIHELIDELKGNRFWWTIKYLIR